MGAPILLAVCLYALVAVADEFGLRASIVPVLVTGLGASPVTAWLLVRSERRHASGPTRPTGREAFGAVVIVAVGIGLSTVVGGVLVLMGIAVAVFGGMFLAAAWELWRGTYRDVRTSAPVDQRR